MSNITGNAGIIEHSIESSGSNELRMLTRSTPSVLVLIVKGDTRPCDKNIDKLQILFSESYFSVQVCSVEEPKEFPVHKTLSRAQYLENYTTRKLLTYAAEGPYVDNIAQRLWTNLPVLIVRDNSSSHISATTMYQHIITALQTVPTADLFFLCKWQDSCHKYTAVTSSALSTFLKWSMQPTATQAVIYRPQARDYFCETLLTAAIPLSKVINNTITQKKFKAIVFTPNIIDFDVGLATSNDDFNKLNQCLAVTEDSTSINWVNVAWFIVVLIAMILVGWLIITTQ